MSKKVVKGVKTKEEERFLKLQHKVQAEEDLAQKKEEMLHLFLKDKLQKEKKEKTLNLLKLNEGWKKILLQVQDAEMLNDITMLKQTFEKKLDEKNSIIQRLMLDLQEADRQDVQQNTSYLQHVERLQAEQDEWLKDQQQLLDSNLQELGSKRKMTREDPHFQAPGLQRPVEMIQIHKFPLIQSEDNLLKKMEAEIQDLQKIQLQRQKDHQLVLSKTKELEQKTSRDQKQQRRISGLWDECFQLTQQIAFEKEENNKMEQNLSSIRDREAHQLWMMRDQQVKDEQVQKNSLRTLSAWSDVISKKLQSVINQGEKVLKLDEMSRKLEDRLGVLTSSLVSTEDRRPVWDGPAQEILELEELQQRFNKSLLHKEVLRNQKLDLSRENKQLELLLSQDTENLLGHPTQLQVTQLTLSVTPAADKTPHH